MSEPSAHKLIVVLNDAGEVVGSNYALAGAEPKAGGPERAGRPIAAAGQRLVEIPMTEDFHFVDSAAALHERVARQIGRGAKKAK